MKAFYSLFAFSCALGVATFKGYNAMGFAYMGCMSLFCLMCSSIKFSAILDEGRAVVDITTNTEA
jgi:hypothetical protein